MKRILVVDDHPIMRFGLAQLVRAEADMELCGEAGTAAEAMAHCEKDCPDLVMLDVALPDKNGLELIKDLRAIRRNLLIMVVSMHDEKVYAERALRAGARAYVMKEEAPGNLIRAARKVLDGGIFVSEQIAARIVESFAGTSAHSVSPIERLTDRELEVFRLIGEGKASREIAAQLHISIRTIDAHRAHIKEKLALKDGTELVHYAIRWVETGEFVPMTRK